MRFIPLLAVLAAIPTLSLAKAGGYVCDYSGPDDFASGPCVLVDGDSAGRYVFTTKVDGRAVRVVTLESAGRWSRVTINGRPGAGYEIHRAHRVYSSDDLALTFEYELR